MPSLAHPDAIFLGLDVHKDSISVGILNPGREVPDVEKIWVRLPWRDVRQPWGGRCSRSVTRVRARSRPRQVALRRIEAATVEALPSSTPSVLSATQLSAAGSLSEKNDQAEDHRYSST